MARMLSEDECGIKFGTLLKLKPIAVAGSEKDISISITGANCEKVPLTFDRAGHNHWDERCAYCFKLPSKEEIWFEFPDTMKKEEIVSLLKKYLEW